MADDAISHLLPEKSRKIYETEYEIFMKWCMEKKFCQITETVVLDYLHEKSKLVRSATLWSKYSMLKATLIAKNNIDIGTFPKVKAFLKRQNVGYIPKKANVFTKEEVTKFLVEAPDEIYLLMKVVLIMGLSGACRREELKKLKIDNIEDKDSFLIVQIPNSKTKIVKTFTVPDSNESPFNPAQICRNYMMLRSKDVEHRQFFLQYKQGKCSVQVVGINQIAKIPSLIATYLKLSNPEGYTSHSFRKSSTSLLVGAEADILKLKRHGSWCSPTVTQEFVEEEIEEKVNIASQFLMNKESETVQSEDQQISSPEFNICSSVPLSISSIKITDINNRTITINVINNK